MNSTVFPLVSGSPLDQLRAIPLYVPLLAAAVAALTVTVIVLAWRLRATRPAAGDRPPSSGGADALTRAAAAIATIVAGQGMWQFLERVIPHVHWGIRALMFAFLEIAVVTSAVRARRSMREKYAAGVDGVAVWVLTGVSAALAAMEAASVPEAVFRLAAPLVAAWLWERGMAVERRRITGRSRINWRITPERILVRLGLAEASERSAGEVDTQRRIARVALAAKRARALRAAGVSGWRLRRALTRFERALDAATAHTGLARDAAVQRALLDMLSTTCGGAALLDLPAAPPWARLDHPAVTGERKRREAEELARALDRWSGAVERNRQSADPALREATAAVQSLAAYVRSMPVPPAPPWQSAPVSAQESARSERPSGQSAGAHSAQDGQSAPPRNLRPLQPRRERPAGARDGKQRAREFWDEQVASGRLPETAEIAKAAGIGLSTARRYRAEWRREPAAAALAAKHAGGTASALAVAASG